MKKIGIFSVAVLLVLAGCAAMQDANPFGASGAFNTLDQSGDSMISQEEAAQQPTLAKTFARIDTNNDNKISEKEYQAATTTVTRGVNFEQVDRNNDGVISQREANAMPFSLRETFARVDADSDGNISQVEYQAATTNLLQGINFQALDTDNDGVLSQDETTETPVLSDDFDRIDADGDGLISRDEFTTAQR
jgi:Ca2+-binding EF-hand superfamily protein